MVPPNFINYYTRPRNRTVSINITVLSLMNEGLNPSPRNHYLPGTFHLPNMIAPNTCKRATQSSKLKHVGQRDNYTYQLVIHGAIREMTLPFIEVGTLCALIYN